MFAVWVIFQILENLLIQLQNKRIQKKLLALLAISLLVLTASCSDSNQSTTTVFTNVNGYSFDNTRELEKFTTLVIDSGKVMAIGDDRLVENFSEAIIIDGQGKTLIPGITDAHGHVSSLGYTLLQIDLRDTSSARQAATQIADYAQKKPYLNWIRGRGWNQVLWPGQQFPSAKILDELVSDRPIWLERIDGHAGWANSKALALAGINANTISPPGGEILRDAEGQPTGILIDNAMNIINQVLPLPSAEELAAALDAATTH